MYSEISTLHQLLCDIVVSTKTGHYMLHELAFVLPKLMYNNKHPSVGAQPVDKKS